MFLAGKGHMSVDFFIALMWVSKEAGKDWDNCFISFTPFLCVLCWRLLKPKLLFLSSNHLQSCCFSNQRQLNQGTSPMPYYVPSLFLACILFPSLFKDVVPWGLRGKPRSQKLRSWWTDFIHSLKRSHLRFLCQFL